MIEIITGTLEEQIIRLMQKTYPITTADLQKELKVSKTIIVRILKKFQIQGAVRLEPLPGKTYIRLLRNDFHFIGKKQQKNNKLHREKKKNQPLPEDNGRMYS